MTKEIALTAIYDEAEEGGYIGYIAELPGATSKATAASVCVKAQNIRSTKNPANGALAAIPRHREIKKFRPVHVLFDTTALRGGASGWQLKAGAAFFPIPPPRAVEV